MRRAEEYREHAAECRARADRETDQYIRESFLQCAETWDTLASEQEDRAKRLQFRANDLLEIAKTIKSEQHHGLLIESAEKFGKLAMEVRGPKNR